MSEFYSNRLLSISFGLWVSFTEFSQQKSQEFEDRAVQYWLVESKRRAAKAFIEYARYQIGKRHTSKHELARTFHYLILLKKGIIALKRSSSSKARENVPGRSSIPSKQTNLMKYWFKRMITGLLAHIKRRKLYPLKTPKLQSLVANAFGNWSLRVARSKVSHTSMERVSSVDWNGRVRINKLRWTLQFLISRRHAKGFHREQFMFKISPKMQAKLRRIYFYLLVAHSKRVKFHRLQANAADARRIGSVYPVYFCKFHHNATKRQQACIVHRKLNDFYWTKTKKRYMARMISYQAARLQRKQVTRNTVTDLDLFSIWKYTVVPILMARWEVYLYRRQLDKRRHRLASFHHRTRAMQRCWMMYQNILCVVIRSSSRCLSRAAFFYSIRALSAAVRSLTEYSSRRSRQRFAVFRGALFWKYWRSIMCVKLWILYARDRRAKRQAVRQATVGFQQAQTRTACRLVVQQAVNQRDAHTNTHKHQRYLGAGVGGTFSYAHTDHRKSTTFRMRATMLAKKVVIKWRRFVALRRLARMQAGGPAFSNNPINERNLIHNDRRWARPEDGITSLDPSRGVFVGADVEDVAGSVAYSSSPNLPCYSPIGNTIENAEAARIFRSGGSGSGDGNYSSSSSSSSSSIDGCGVSDRSETAHLWRAAPRAFCQDFVSLPVSRAYSRTGFSFLPVSHGETSDGNGSHVLGSISSNTSCGSSGNSFYSRHTSSAPARPAPSNRNNDCDRDDMQQKHQYRLSSEPMDGEVRRRGGVDGNGGSDNYSVRNIRSHSRGKERELEINQAESCCSSSIISSASSAVTSKQKLVHELLDFIAEFKQNIC